MYKPLSQVAYYDVNEDNTKSAYFLREENGSYYFTNGLSICFAEHLKRESDIISFDSFSLPTNWTKITPSPRDYKYTPEGLVKANFQNIIQIIEDDFTHIHRIGQFLQEFWFMREVDTRVLRGLGIAVAISKRNLPEKTLTNLVSIVLQHYQNLLQPYITELLLDNLISPYIDKDALIAYQ